MPWNLAREKSASLEQELAGNAFAISGPTYRSRPGTGTPPREDWKQKLEKETGAREVWVTAENKTGPCLVCKEKHVYQRKLPWGSLS